MKQQILHIAEQLKTDKITDNDAKLALMSLFNTDMWISVADETPPSSVEILAKAPDGCIHLTSWRSAYSIFACQNKTEHAHDWQWKLV